MIPTRESVRALIVDGAGRVLLSRVTPLGTTDGRNLWVTLGGRVKEGESLPEALSREMAEELAETRYEPGPRVWFGDEIVTWNGSRLRLVEHFYLVTYPAADYAFIGAEEEEKAGTHELRWWTPDDVIASGDKFVPCDLGSLLRELFAGPTPLNKRIRLEGDG